MNWHQKYKEKRTFGEKLADNVASTMGSWRFIIIQSVFIILWATVNVLGIIYEWDKYPFILLNLLFSVQAAYAAPIIMMSQNRQNEKERIKAEEDYETNKAAKVEIESLIKTLDRLEVQKLDRIMKALDLKVEFIVISGDMHEEAQKLYPGAHESSERAAFVKGVTWQYKRSTDERRN